MATRKHGPRGSHGAQDDPTCGVHGLTLEDRARLRAAHLDTVARYVEAGIAMTLRPEQLRDTARTLRALADVCDPAHPCTPRLP
jgi:hypothetical protein